jgi:DNA-binding transcriptional LysR family regulator
MRITQLRQANLNLLVVFTALAEERSVSRAASRLLLSQPAVSRALQRLREMFHDDLLIRTAGGYEPTPRGERLMQELAVTLPRLDRLLSGTAFDPMNEDAAFRVAVTDNASQVLCPSVCRRLLPFAGRVSCQFVALSGTTFEDMERARIDLALNAADGHAPSAFTGR